MTDSKTYQVRGAEVIVTASLYPGNIDLHITLDLSPLDRDLPDHSPHGLINYIDLPGHERLHQYQTAQTYWWAKLHRKVTVKTGAQANRVIKAALVKIDDAVADALIARTARMSHMANVFP